MKKRSEKIDLKKRANRFISFVMIMILSMTSINIPVNASVSEEVTIDHEFISTNEIISGNEIISDNEIVSENEVISNQETMSDNEIVSDNDIVSNNSIISENVISANSLSDNRIDPFNPPDELRVSDADWIWSEVPMPSCPGTEPTNLSVVSDLTVYSAEVTVSWTKPSLFQPEGYMIYVDNGERYRTEETNFTFHDMAPYSNYQVCVRAYDASGYIYDVSNKITISTTYRDILLVGKSDDCTYHDINTAINNAAPGDVVLIKNGNYTGKISIPKACSGTNEKWITVRSEGNQVNIFGCISVNAEYVRVSGLQFYAYREVTDSEKTIKKNGKTYLVNDEQAEVKTYRKLVDGKEEKKVTKYILYPSVGTGASISNANNVQLTNTDIRDGFTCGISVGGTCNAVVNYNRILNCAKGMSISGEDLFIEKNDIEALSTYKPLTGGGDSDYFRIFGENVILRGNYCHGSISGPHMQGSHVDFVQVYDNNMEKSRHILIENNLMTDFIHQGFMLENGYFPDDSYVADWTIRNNILNGFTAWGMCASAAIKNLRVENNVFIGAEGSYHGIWVRGSSEKGSAVIRNNILMNTNSAYGGMDGAVLQEGGNNLFYNVRDAKNKDNDIVGQDPMFVNAEQGDYRLQSSSPAIDAGRNVDIHADTQGNSRPYGGGVDIGAFEYQGVISENQIRAVLLSESNTKMCVGERKKLETVLYPIHAAVQTPEWASSDESVLKVDAAGTVQAIAPGKAHVTATIGGFRAVCQITVEAISPFVGIKINNESLDFDPTVYDYEMNVDYNVTSIEVTPVFVSGSMKGETISSGGNAQSQEFTLESGVPSQEISLLPGANTIHLIFDSEDYGGTYSITVNRLHTISWNALKDFSLVQGEKQWYYYKQNGSGYQELNVHQVKGIWTNGVNASMYQCSLGRDRFRADASYNAVKAWEAPQDGNIRIVGEAKRKRDDGEGFLLTIKRNEKELWKGRLVTKADGVSHDINIDVNRGDKIYFIANAGNAGNSSDFAYWSPTILLSTLMPDAPHTLTAKAVTDNSVTLEWEAPTNAGTIKEYEIYCNDNLSGKADSNTDTYTVDDLNLATEYSFYVKSVDDTGNRSARSNVIIAKTKTEFPKGFWISDVSDQEYTGKSIKPKIRVYDYAHKLSAGTDYSISYRNNKEAYTEPEFLTNGAKNPAFSVELAPAIIVTGKGNYSGKETIYFRIMPHDIVKEVEIGNLSFIYNKKIQKPMPTIKWNGIKLKKERDFEVTYPDSGEGAYQNIGQYNIQITGKGNFSNTITVQMIIKDKTQTIPISKVKVVSVSNGTYTGSEIIPTIVLKHKGMNLQEGEDYTVTYKNNTEVGTATAVITGINKYTGVRNVKFKIIGISMSKVKVDGATLLGTKKKPVYYTGEAITQSCTLNYPVKKKMEDGSYETINTRLIENKDYVVSYKNNVNAGTATVIFKGIGKYFGRIQKTYTIGKCSLKGNAVRIAFNAYQFAYEKGGTKPPMSVTYRGRDLIPGKEYTVSYKNNDSVGSKKAPTVTLRGKGNFKDAVSKKFTIAQKNMGAVSINAVDKVYSQKPGNHITQVVVLDTNKKALKAGKDYKKQLKYMYRNSTSVQIVDPKSPDGYKTVTRGKGSDVQKTDIVPVGTIIDVRIYGAGPYRSYSSGEYRIVQANVKNTKVMIPAQIYTGEEITLTKEQITIKVEKTQTELGNEDYEIVGYKNNTKKGTASVTIQGKGNYGGTKTVQFKIKAKGFVWWWRNL